jgi:hypothetical protein
MKIKNNNHNEKQVKTMKNLMNKRKMGQNYRWNNTKNRKKRCEISKNTKFCIQWTEF